MGHRRKAKNNQSSDKKSDGVKKNAPTLLKNNLTVVKAPVAETPAAEEAKETIGTLIVEESAEEPQTPTPMPTPPAMKAVVTAEAPKLALTFNDAYVLVGMLTSSKKPSRYLFADLVGSVCQKWGNNNEAMKAEYWLNKQFAKISSGKEKPSIDDIARVTAHLREEKPDGEKLDRKEFQYNTILFLAQELAQGNNSLPEKFRNRDGIDPRPRNALQSFRKNAIDIKNEDIAFGIKIARKDYLYYADDYHAIHYFNAGRIFMAAIHKRMSKPETKIRSINQKLQALTASG